MYDVIEPSPSVSVIIPTHNRCDMLRNAIQSVLDQTYRDLEIVVIDDASNDKTGEIVENFNDERIRYIRHTENKGGSASRNTGISCARGRYIGFLDDDDEWLPTKLELQINRFQKRPHVDVVVCGYFVRDTGNDRVIDSVSPKNSGNIYGDLLWDNTIAIPTVLIKRDILGDSYRFDPELPRLQDWDMWLRLAKTSIFDCIEEPLVIVNIHDNNRISTDSTALLVARMRILEKYWDDIKSNKAILSNHYYRIGMVHFELCNMKKCRQYTKKSIVINPYNLKSLRAFVFSHLGYTLCNRYIEVRRRLTYHHSGLRYSTGEEKRAYRV